MKKTVHIQKPEPAKKKSKLLIFILAAAMLGLFWLLLRPSPQWTLPSTTFEISNFSGQAEIYSGAKKAWVPAARGMIFSYEDKLKTPANSEVDFTSNDQVKFRLKPNSLLESQAPRRSEYKTEPAYLLTLTKGRLLAATDNTTTLLSGVRLATSKMIVVFDRASFLLDAASAPYDWIGVMRGPVTVISRQQKGVQPLSLHTLERTQIGNGKTFIPPVRASREEWDQMKEVYELTQMSTAMEAKQLDLSKKAGDFFRYVFDHGTFYTPKIGYCGREFLLDEQTGGAYLNVEYDVFPKGSFVGVYIKTRDLDIVGIEAFEYEVRRLGEEGVPDAFQIEVKSKGQTVRRFAPRMFHREWQTQRFVFKANQPTPISEFTLLFSHERVGESKKGALQFRNFRMVPKSETPAELIPIASPEPTPITAPDKKDPLDLSEFDDFLAESNPPKDSPK